MRFVKKKHDPNSKAALQNACLYGVSRKKMIIAAVLISVMVFMWVRLLLKNGPESAAANAIHQVHALPTGPSAKITYVELPIVEGKHDMLNRNFFAVGASNFEGGVNVSVISEGGNEELVKRLTGLLRLQAIDTGPTPRAFINDRLLAIGDVLKVADEEENYKCELISIGKDVVVIRSGQTEITLKILAQDILSEK